MFQSKTNNPTVFLHIGTNKTGTTAIQQAFNLHRQQLLEEKILYPVTGCVNDAHYSLSDLLGFKLGNNKATASKDIKNTALYKDLLLEIKTSQCNQVILSSEMFVMPKDIRPIKEFFTDFDIKIIVYLRRHDKWLESAYNQGVKLLPKLYWQPGFENFLKLKQKKHKHFGSYRFLVDRWAEAFGKESIIVRPFENCQNQPHIMADFFNAIGLGDIINRIDLAATNKNESLSAYNIALLEVFKRTKLKPKIRKRLIQYAHSLKCEKDTFSIVNPKLRRKLVEENLSDYAYIAKTYLGRENGQLFFEPLPDPNEDWQAPRVPNSIEMTEHIVTALTRNRYYLPSLSSIIKFGRRKLLNILSRISK